MDFLFGFRECVKFKYYGSPAVMFAIGHALRGHVDEEAKTVFGDNWNFVNLVNPAKQAIAFYEAQISSYRKAVDNWTLVGIRFGVVKDIRRVIAELIWSTRGEALCKVPK
jgi:hypothetical protein